MLLLLLVGASVAAPVCAYAAVSYALNDSAAVSYTLNDTATNTEANTTNAEASES